MSDDLVTWLRAQLDEDERVAMDAGSTSRPSTKMHGAYSRWDVEPQHSDDEPMAVLRQGSLQHPGVLGSFTTMPIEARIAGHIARWDPARVLRKIAADRIVLDYVISELQDDATSVMPMVLALAMASVYSDRPGYRPEWAP